MNNSRKAIILAIAVAVYGLNALCANEARADLIVNGGFEDGNFTGWTVSASATNVETAGYDGYSPESGTYFAALGNVGNSPLGTLSQTVTDTSGASYTLSMWLGSDGQTPNEFKVQWDGTTLYDQTNLPDTRGNASQYNLLSFTVTGTGSDTLTISERNDPSYLALDDVSLNQQGGSAPEPSSLALFGTIGLTLAGYRGWRRKRAVIV